MEKKAKFEKPTILKSAEILKQDENVVKITHTEYKVNGKAYPKLVLSTYKVDEDNFPRGQPKSVGLPIEMSKEIAQAILSIYDE